MPQSPLELALKKSDWVANVSAFTAAEQNLARVDALAIRNATWAQQLEVADEGNPALPFLRETQAAFTYSVSLIALALYKPAAAAMRSMFESALYYTYFRTHPAELGTLLRDDSYFVDRKELVEYHQRHSRNFGKWQAELGVLQQMTEWYAKMSTLVHSKVPGSWIEHTSITGIAHNARILEEVLKDLEAGAELVHRLFLCTVAPELWVDFTSPAKAALLSGLPGPVKRSLGLDSA